MNANTGAANGKDKTGYNRFLLLVAGLGGLLYGVDVGIIAGALPYLEATSGLTAGELSYIVAAVLAGSVISTIFSGMLSDLLGRKKMMIISGILFVVSIPMIALAHGFGPLVAGRLLQGISAGFVGVAVPLYLAECLGAANRGKGTGVFQWLLTLGICAAALIAMGFSAWLGGVESDVAKGTATAAELFAAKNLAWRSIFWVSLPPGVLFVIGSFIVSESPRWLFRKGRKDAAKAALLRSRTPEQAEVELREMEEAAINERRVSTTGTRAKESLLRRKYLIPFILACVILACNQLTGVNSIIGYNATILIQAGLSDVSAHWGYVILTAVNFLITMIGVALVDKKGRKFLLSFGSAGIIVSLLCVAFIFNRTEKQRVDCAPAVQAMVKDYRNVVVKFEKTEADKKANSDKDLKLTFVNSLLANITNEQGSVVIQFTKELGEVKIVKTKEAEQVSEWKNGVLLSAKYSLVDENEKPKKEELDIAFADGGKIDPISIDDTVVKSVSTSGKNLTLAMIPKIIETKLEDPYSMAKINFNQEQADQLLASAGEKGKAIYGKPSTMIVIYSCGDFRAATKVVRSTDQLAELKIDRASCVPANKGVAFFSNPFANLDAARTAPLKIENALITPVPSTGNGWLTAIFIFIFMGFFAVGPGVCVWLALSELMPTRIRSNGMAIALVINQSVSTVIAAVFLPTVGKYGYATMFFAFAGCTVIYFITATFFLPETKGKTLEEIEAHFEGKKS